jgi:hypothetical protein
LYRAKPSRLKKAEGQEVFQAFFVYLFLRKLGLLKCPELSYNERKERGDRMGTMQGEDGSVVVFDGEVRLNPQQKQRFLSGLIIIPGGCVIWAIWIMLLLEMMMKVEKQSSAIMILMIALFSVIPIMWLGNRLQRKILHRHLRIIDWGQEVSFIVGKKEQRFDWQDLEDMRIEHFYDRFGEISSIKLELFFQGDGYYYIDAWGQASQELSYFAQGLQKYLDQRGDQFDYC